VRTLEFGKSEGRTAGPSTALPGFPLELSGVDEHHAPLPYRKAHTLPCPVQRGRKSGCAPVGMTKGKANASMGKALSISAVRRERARLFLFTSEGRRAQIFLCQR
jgi:hypothetical protein